MTGYSGLRGRGYGVPRAGVFGRRPRSTLEWAFARDSPLRHIDWILLAVVGGLSAIGTLLVWSATQPGLIQQDLDPRTYLKKQLLNVVIGVAMMIAVGGSTTGSSGCTRPLSTGSRWSACWPC